MNIAQRAKDQVMPALEKVQMYLIRTEAETPAGVYLTNYAHVLEILGPDPREGSA